MSNNTGYIRVRRAEELVRFDKCPVGLFEFVDDRGFGNPKPELFVKLDDGESYSAYAFKDGAYTYFGKCQMVRPVNIRSYTDGCMAARFADIPYGFLLYRGKLYIKTSGEVYRQRGVNHCPYCRTFNFELGCTRVFSDADMVEPLVMVEAASDE